MREDSKGVHPAVFTLLVLPFGAVSGFVGTALAFLASKAGMDGSSVAAVVAWTSFVNMWKFTWAPVVDTTLTRRTWFLIALVGSVAGIVALSAMPLGPDSYGPLVAVVVGASFFTTVQAMALEAFMAHVTAEEDRGRAGGWFQAGNLGGYGIGGGLGLYMMTHLPAPWMAGASLGLLFLLAGLPIMLLPDVPAEKSEHGPIAAIAGAFRELVAVLMSREGFLSGFLCLLPVGTGAASSVLSQAEVAAFWGAGETQVALVNGVFNGVLSSLGCLAGGMLCGRWRGRTVYLGVGAALAAVAFLMALAPHTPTVFSVFGLLYAFVTGMAFAAYTAFVLEAIGQGSAATKFNGFAALANTPIWYMGLALGRTADTYDPTRMLYLEGGAALVGIAVLLVVMRLMPAPSPVAAAA